MDGNEQSATSLPERHPSIKTVCTNYTRKGRKTADRESEESVVPRPGNTATGEQCRAVEQEVDSKEVDHTGISQTKENLKGKDFTHIGESVKERIKAEMKASIIKGPRSVEDEQARSDIVDEMFRDFLAEKMELVEKEYVRKRKIDDVPKTSQETSEGTSEKRLRSSTTHSAENVSKETKHRTKETKSKQSGSKKMKVRAVPLHIVDATDCNIEEVTPEAMVHVRTMTPALRNLAETDSSHEGPSVVDKVACAEAASRKSVPEKLTLVPSVSTEGKKPVLSLKISSASADLISSGRTTVPAVKRKKQLEEGEVMSSESEDTTDDDSDEEDEDGKREDGPSETGSISDSDTEKVGSKPKKKKKKHKHKHKHKKKKKKSSKSSKGKKKKSTKSRSHSLSPRSRRRSRSRSPYRDRSPGSRKRSPSPSYYRDRSPGRSDSKWVAEKGKPVGLLSRSYRERHGLCDSTPSRRESRDRSRGQNDDGREKRRDSELQIDKAKLRKIAIANAVNMMKSGAPGQVTLGSDSMAKLKAGGKSVEELTDYCKKISERERERQLLKLQNAEDSLSDSSEDYQGAKSEEEDFTVHHPFTVKEAPNIVMNIRNSKQLPTLTPQEKVTESAKLRLTFPVSSGSQHRAKESEWVPVEKSTPQATPATTTTTTAEAKVSSSGSSQTTTVPVTPTPTTTTPTTTTITTAAEAAIEVATVAAPDKVFPDPPKLPMDIGRIVSERLAAVRRLQKNPNDVQAISQMRTAQKKASLWAESKVLPGQFMGSTGATILSQQELMGPDKKRQAWARKEQLTTAAPLSGGLGMMMLQKLGWKQGEGLGKNKDGPQTPLLLDVKIDRKGLTSQDESHKRTPAPKPQKTPVRDLSGKHPVSALVELCSKRRWGTPDFILVSESGPAHKKNFVFKVGVNGVEYQSSMASNNKKQAKAQAATVCLQELGLVPR